MVRIELFLPNWRTSTKSKNIWRWNERIHSKFLIYFAKGAYYFSFSAIQKCLAAKMFATMNFYHFQWIVYGP